MPQKTNLNVNPYYDDFDKEDNFYRVLFKPGHPIQARELTGLQSILQNQIESFGSHIFKEGSMVIPGGITCDNAFTTVKVNPDHLGIDITVYLDALVSANNGKGVKLVGQSSSVVGSIKGYLLPPEEGVEEITLFIKYRDGGSDSESIVYEDGEILALEENVTYGNTTLNSGDTVLTLVSTNATSTGYAVGLSEGVYFIRGVFVDVPTSRIILDPYDTNPSYRVGLDILEEIVTSDEDTSLNDNAKGFTNYSAPGADRLKISVKLSKKQLTDTNDTNFVELVRIDNGEIKKLQDKSNYSIIKDYFAKRTFEESGNYAVDPFTVDVLNSLNDEVGNGGLYIDTQKTEQGNTPSDDLMSIKLSAGAAYVKGFDIDLVGSTIVDVPKPRKTKRVNGALIPFAMGSLLKVNNVYGTPHLTIGGSNNTISLYNRRRDTSVTNAGTGEKIGDARVYWFGVSDAPYSDASTEWDLYLFDIQTYTRLTLAKSYTTTQVPNTSFVRGLSSGATGYLESRFNGDDSIFNLSQTSGTFLTGEQIIINENQNYKVTISSLKQFGTEDIKSVYQDSDTLNANLGSDFIADAVLYPKRLSNFSITDKLNITTGGAATSPGRFFSGVTGIKEDSIVRYQIGGQTLPTFNRVDQISADGTTLTLSALDTSTAIPGVCIGALPGSTTESVFAVMSPKILNLKDSGLYSDISESNIASVDLADSNLIITKQITNQSTNLTGSLTINVSDVVDVSAGITSVFYESFDAERYTVAYSDGTIEDLTSDQFTLGTNGTSATFTGLRTSQTGVTVNVTLRKINVSSKTKNFVRSRQLVVSRTSGVSTATGLTTSIYYGTRVEDNEISLNVPDVVSIRAVYESTNNSTPVLDKLTFATGLALDTNAIVGETIVGKNSRAVAQVVNRTATEIEFVYRNQNKFEVGESVTFKDSSIVATIQLITNGSYVDRTSNYELDKGHRKQFCDYSRIRRRKGSASPSRKLLVIFDYYKIGEGNVGDLFTVNSYTKDRFTTDIPTIEGGTRATDTLDFRARVAEFDPSTTNASPFAFGSRSYETTYSYIISPDESSLISYSYYQPRVDLVTLNRLGEVEVIVGESDDNPQAPVLTDDAMEIAQIRYGAYLYDPVKDSSILLRDNRRFTMRDIAKLEERIENLEEVTSLSLLELSTKTLEVVDAQGLDRFKSGFIVSDFRDKSLANIAETTVDISKSDSAAVSPVDFWSMNAELALDPAIDRTKADLSQNLKLLDSNIQKTGDLLTLSYQEVDWINQPHATNVENVNPFNVIVFVGGVVLDPAADNWVRTIYVDDHRVESTGANWTQEANVNVNVDSRLENYQQGNRTLKREVATTTTTTSYTPKLQGPSREFNYVEDVKVSGDVDPFMRSRNVYFNANGLRPFTKHYLYLDSQQVDIIPKLCEIQMQSGVFQVFEDADIFESGRKVGFIRIQKPNHKFGDTSRPDIGAGLGSPAVLVEEYNVDPYDRTRPAPGDSYSATSRLINFGTRVLSTQEKYYGYVSPGCTVVGRTSGAIARITRAELISDNWGDIVANFFFRDPNSTPQPQVKVKSGTKTVKVTAVPPGVTPLPGSTVFASEAIGTYSGSGTILTQETSRVSVRNPPKPATKATEIDVKVKATHRDPLAQSFTVDGKGAFLTSFDLYFATKDPGAKVFIELRTVELGTPTQFLVQDYTQVALNPNDININEANPFEPIPTRVRFPSPVYLEADKEYAIVILSPASDGYEMWTATMGKKTVRTQNLPNVQNVVVTKQYIGGSLFKSQNGTIWTPSQYQDLTFKLYKAKFVPSGTVTFYNTDITPKGENTSSLVNNPIEGLPRKLKLPVTGVNGTVQTQILEGTKIGEGTSPSVTGIVENLGGPITSSSIVSAGTGYDNGTFTNVPLYSISGNGTGAEATVVVSGNIVSSVTLTDNGSGYVEGEVLGITTSNVTKGTGAKIGVVTRNATFDTIYLTNVQGENFTNTSTIVYYTDINDESTRTNTAASVNGTSSLISDKYSGNVFRIKQYNHAHHGGNNKISIVDVEPDRERVALTAQFGLNDTTVSVANTSVFATFEGITTSRGYALIQNEVVSYSAITQGSGGAGTLTIDGRALNGTVKSVHTSNDFIQPYEVNGVSLMRINKEHDIPSTYYNSENSNLDNYFLEVDRTTPTNRSSGSGMVNFAAQKGIGGNTVGISQNHQFSSIEASFNVITPGKGTSTSSQLRTISGTSAGGNEVSFLDQGYQSIPLNRVVKLNTPRMVASRTNEIARLTTLPSNKSLSLKVDFRTENEDLSPVMDIQNATFILGRNKSNNPITDYTLDDRSNKVDGDPHGSVFVTKTISLEQPATSLRVIVAASRQEGADFRVFYRLFKADSSEVLQAYVPFPGYDNLLDTDGDGYGDRVIDPDKNSGRADAFVSPDRVDSYSEYQFTANNLDQFDAFAIKVVMSSTNESTPVKLKDFRCIALA